MLAHDQAPSVAEQVTTTLQLTTASVGSVDFDSGRTRLEASFGRLANLVYHHSSPFRFARIALS